MSDVLALAMVLAMFAGCGNSAAENTTEAPKADSPAAKVPAEDDAEPVSIVSGRKKTLFCVKQDRGSLHIVEKAIEIM